MAFVPTEEGKEFLLIKANDLYLGKSINILPSPDFDYYRLEVDGVDITQEVDEYDMMPDRRDSCLFCHESPCCIAVGEELWNLLDDRYLELFRASKSPGQIRYGMYRVAHQHINGWLGKHNRTPLPHCVVGHIKALAPDPKGKYVGFRNSKDK